MTNIFNEILNMSWDASVLIAAVVIVRIFTQKLPKNFRKMLWGLVCIRLLIPFSFKSDISLHPGDSFAAAEYALQAENVTSDKLPSILTAVWLVIGALLIIYGVVSYLKLKIKISDAVKEKDNIYLSEKVDSPFVCGFIKPKIYFPYNLEESTKECILAHEKAHIKHGDHFLKTIGFILLCTYWFNPLVWLSYFLFCKDIELCCDESVLKNYDKENRKKYANAIFEIGVNKVRLSACPVAFGEVGIKQRIKNAVSYRKATKLIIFISVFLCVLIALLFMTEPKAQAQEPVKQPAAKTEEKIEPQTEQKIPVPETTLPQTTEPVTEVETEVETTKITSNNIQETEGNTLDLAMEAYEEMQKRQAQRIKENEEFFRKHGISNNSNIERTDNSHTTLPVISFYQEPEIPAVNSPSYQPNTPSYQQNSYLGPIRWDYGY